MAIYNAVPPPPELAPATSSASATQQAVAGAGGGVTSLGHQHHPSTASTVDIEAWTVSALEALSVSPVARGTGTPLSIPLDHDGGAPRAASVAVAAAVGSRVVSIAAGHPAAGMTPPRRPPSARDSQRRRELLLKGNEGSRQRRRWENDRLMHVPGAQPPQPGDYEPKPTHTVHAYVPYHVAQLWDRGLRQRVEEERARAAAARVRRQRRIDAGLPITPSPSSSSPAVSGGVGGRPRKQPAEGLAEENNPSVGRVSRELRDTAKRTPALKGWVRVLEEPVRRFLVEEEARRRGELEERRKRRKEAAATAAAAAAAAAKARSPPADSAGESGLDSEDEEIVFVGRQRRASSAGDGGKEKPTAIGWKKAHREVRGGGGKEVDSGVVFDGLGDDESAAFKRWLTHSISDYYGLASRSATVGAPPRRVVYVGIKSAGRKPLRVPAELPRPLWELF